MSAFSNQINVFCNHFVRRRLRRRWKALGEHPVSILSNNCLAGLIYHDLGLRFDSPTINLCMPLPSFVDMMENLDASLSADIQEEPESGRPYPVGRLLLASGKVAVSLHFMHYRSFTEAVSTWRKRCVRVDPSRIVLIAADNAPCMESELRRFHLLPFPKLLLTPKTETASILGEDAVLFPELSCNNFRITDFCGLWGRRFYHRIDVPETMFQLLLHKKCEALCPPNHHIST